MNKNKKHQLSGYELLEWLKCRVELEIDQWYVQSTNLNQEIHHWLRFFLTFLGSVPPLFLGIIAAISDFKPEVLLEFYQSIWVAKSICLLILVAIVILCKFIILKVEQFNMEPLRKYYYNEQNDIVFYLLSKNTDYQNAFDELTNNKKILNKIYSKKRNIINILTFLWYLLLLITILFFVNTLSSITTMEFKLFIERLPGG